MSVLLSCRNLSHSAGSKTLFRDVSLSVARGDKIGLSGHNGCGKTSLLALITESYRQVQASGDFSGGALSFSPQAELGYYDQELNEVAGEGHQTMLDFLRAGTSTQEATLRNGLINAGFAYLDHDRRVNVLSGGERARLMFLMLKLNRPNFLIMDEPTNHIDIDGREELEDQLAESDAILLMTSHDRRFIDNVANRFLLVANGVLREIAEPDIFYQAAAASREDAGIETERTGTAAAMSDVGPVVSADAGSPGVSVDLPSAEDLLERIVELEELLAADLARKP